MRDVLARRQVGEVDAVALEPLAPRLERGNLCLDFVVVDQATVDGVGQEHAARLQATLANHLGWVDVCDTDFGCEHNKAVIRDDVATGAKAVAVEGCANQRAVGEDNGRRTIPRLHE